MHSWSFCFQKARLQATGFIDRPNPWAAELFDRFLERFAPEIEFVTAGQAVESGQELFPKAVDYAAVYPRNREENLRKLRQILAFIQKKACGRHVVIWGRGWWERLANELLSFHRLLDIPFYISRDAAAVRTWRGRPVKTFEEAEITPEYFYVFVMARSNFPEIRNTLRTAGFSEYEDFCDIEAPVPSEEWENLEPNPLPPCPICGGLVYDTYNAQRPRRCIGCGSLERTRTMAGLFSEVLGMETLRGEILHISPSKPERMFFRQVGACNVKTLDIRPEVRADIAADLCAMPQVKSDSFDMVLANCVLNHVYDDDAALVEIHRILRKKGLFVVYVMGEDRMKTTVDRDPAAWYGKQTMEQYRVGTFRHYGEADFTVQLKNCFDMVRCYEKYDQVTGDTCCWYVCEK